jgi:hypothetical protein
MSKVSRNALCPCGSGKKYKKCCLARDEQAEREQTAADGAAPRVLDWLLQQYPDEAAETLASGYYGRLSPEQRQGIGELPEHLVTMDQFNAFEWLLAEGGTELEGKPVRFMDLVLGQGGLLLEASQRRYLETLSGQPMGIYEVIEATPNEGLTLVDTLSPEREAFWIRERTASRTLRPGDVFGGRVVPMEPMVLSGAVYPFERSDYLRLRGEILKAPRLPDGEIDPASVSSAIIDHWLWSLVGPPPTIVDASSGEPVLLTTIHFRVKSWGRLREALGRQPDVEEEGKDEWVHLPGTGEEGRRVLHTIRRGKKDRIELFARTKGMAEKGERWLKKIAGDTVEKLLMEASDPRHLWKDRHQPAPREPSDDFLESVPPDQLKELYEQMYRGMYRNWADEPIPALDGRTPRQAIRTKEGRREVVELLRSYEIGELQQAEQQGREPVGLGFLWDELGIVREKHVRPE